MKSLYAPAFSAEWFHPIQAQGIGCGNCAHYTPTGEAGHGTCGFFSKDIEIEGESYTVFSVVNDRFGCFAFKPKGA